VVVAAREHGEAVVGEARRHDVAAKAPRSLSAICRSNASAFARPTSPTRFS
jgi:hypothetical protein